MAVDLKIELDVTVGEIRLETEYSMDNRKSLYYP